ncbi:MAG: DUF2897 family protein [Steroidobacteraceae bacterium]|jgi:hypothetical protein
MRGLIIIVVVVAALVGGLLTLRSSRSAGMPDKDVINRAKLREREQAAKDDQES